MDREAEIKALNRGFVDRGIASDVEVLEVFRYLKCALLPPFIPCNCFRAWDFRV